MTIEIRGTLVLVTAGLLAACSPASDPRAKTAATPATAEFNRAVAQALPLSDAQDFDDARRGFIATDEPLAIVGPDGSALWQASVASTSSAAWESWRERPTSAISTARSRTRRAGSSSPRSAGTARTATVPPP